MYGFGFSAVDTPTFLISLRIQSLYTLLVVNKFDELPTH